jgi:glycosyltransferase involved in cell wall biosynthesis
MPIASEPSVSAVIASYNCAEYLPDAIDSLLAQTYPPSEIIVVDDGSTDDTPKILGGYSRRVRSIRQDNAGDAAARNRGIESATGDYVVIQDADDVSAKDRVEKQVAALWADPEAIACFAGHWLFDQRGVITSYSPTPELGRRDSLEQIGRCLVFCPTVMFDRRRARDLWYPRDVVLSSDMCFVSLLRTRGHFAVLPDSLYGYRRRTGQLTRRFTFLEGFRNRLRWLEFHWREYWGDKTFPQIEQAMWRGLVDSMVAFYWSRDRERFLQCRTYLREHWPPTMARPRECNWLWYPDWLWAARELAGRQLARVRR